MVEDNNNTGLNKNIKKLLTIFFVLTLASIFIFLIIVSISVNNCPIPTFPFIMAEHMWKAFFIVPIPIVSTILGFIYKRKGYNCKRNIIVGFIMTFILCVCGSFTNAFAGDINHNIKHAEELSATISLVIPSDSYVSYTNDFENNEYLMMIKISNSSSNTFLEEIKNNENWEKDTSSIPSNIISLYDLIATQDYDYFSVFNKSKGIYSNYSGKLIFLAYDVEDRYLYVSSYK